MTPRVALLILGLAVGCADGVDAAAVPADCTRAEAVQLITGARSGDFILQPARDTTFLILRDEDGQVSTYAGQGCGADATRIVKGARLLPTRIAVDPHDDDPTLLCDPMTLLGYRGDLAGRRAPELLLPYFSCVGQPTNYGALFMSRWSLALHLFADFPDESTALLIRERVSDVVVLDEWVVSHSAGKFQTYALATGEVVDIPADVVGLSGRGEHVLWFSSGQPATVALLDLRNHGSAVLGIYDREAAASDQYIPNFPYWTWGFDRTGQYVYHLLPGASEAFDLAGDPAALPAPGVVIQLLEGGGALSVTDEDGRLHVTRPRDTVATALDATYDRELRTPRLREIGGHLEQVVDGAVRRIDLDGSPARTIVTDVGAIYEWLDEHRLASLTGDGTLTRIDIATGQRAALAEHVSSFQLEGEGLYFIRNASPHAGEDGIWYLSAAALDASE